MKFAPAYVDHVLNENFEDAKELFLAPLMAINYAHLVMLVEQGIVSRSDGHCIREALDSISHHDIQRTKYDGTYEDLFFYVERLIADACGPDGAGRRRTAAHRALPQRHRHDDVPHAAARVHPRTDRRHLRAPTVAARSRGSPS